VRGLGRDRKNIGRTEKLRHKIWFDLKRQQRKKKNRKKAPKAFLYRTHFIHACNYRNMQYIKMTYD